MSAVRARAVLVLLALAFGAGLLAAPNAVAKSKESDKRHTWSVVLLRGKVHHTDSSPDHESPFPVIRRGRGDQIQFVSRDDRYWIRFRGPSPLRLKGDVVQRFEVFPIGITPNPIYTFTTDSPPDSAEWERFHYEVYRAQDMPKATADQEPEIHVEARPDMPNRQEAKKKKLPVELVIDVVK